MAGRKKIVTIGGGTGSFALLRGLKEYPYDITAIVTMFDSGGSSGLLRDEHGVLPPGDVRRCLIALSDGEQEETLRKLFNFRFKNGGSLKGHSFGNILLTALKDILGSDEKAIKEASALLKIRGAVLPVSLTQAHICAELENGETIEGESQIDIPKHNGNLRIKKVFLKPPAPSHTAVFDALTDADAIIFGPGDLYTSVIPNLLVGGIAKTIQKSNAKKIFVLNLFTKWGETQNFKASDFARELLRYAGIKQFDSIIYNDASISDEALSKYAAERKFPVPIDADIQKYSRACVSGDLCFRRDMVRHDSRKLADIVSRVV